MALVFPASRRDGKLYNIGFSRGTLTSPLKMIGEADTTGTTVTFLPDSEIFPVTTFKYETLKHRLRELAFLNTGISITITDERQEITTENGIDPGVFDGLDFVIAGHIHKRQEIKKNGVKIVYCSSIKQKDFGETVNQHGFVLWKLTPKTNTYEFVDVENPNVGYYKFKIDSIQDIEDNKEELLNY